MVRDEDSAAIRAWMNGFDEDNPILGRLSVALGSSALTLPRDADGSVNLTRDVYDATVGGRPVSAQVLGLGRPDTDSARIELARERVALMGHIRSPHVVQVLSSVAVLDGYPGALGWLEERTLSDPFVVNGEDSNTPWTVEQVSALLHDLGAGVAAFHAVGARAWPRLGGIGRRQTGEYVLTNGNLVFALRMTPKAGVPVADLVPYFQSPEDGRAGPPSLAGDVFTLGVLAYILLTGHPPVAAGSRPATDFLSITATDAEEYTANLATMTSPAVQSVRPDVPDHLALVIDHCLQPDETNRYRDAAELLDHLHSP